jgi:plasmid stabilization system protein ParE
MKYTLRVSPATVADIRANAVFLRSNFGLARAERWRNAIARRIESLTLDPFRCPQAEEAATLGVDLRQLLHGRDRHVFRILFTVVGNRVEVHRVRHAAQDWLDEGEI